MKTGKFSSFAFGTAITLSLAAFANPAFAQEGAGDVDSESYGDEILVTAQRRAEASVDVPITVTALGAEQLAAANVQQLGDIAKITPSLRFDQSGFSVQPTIRGIGTSVVGSGSGSNVGIYIDGFYSPNPAVASFQLMNTESIQVLKGPQGTLFGRNTTGGAILIQSADPSTDARAQMKVSYGRYNEARAQGYATMGLSENVAFDVEGIYSRGDGWVEDIATGSKDGGDYENWSIRLGLKAQLSDAVSVLLRYSHQDVNDASNLLTNAYVDPELGIAVASFAPPSSYTTRPGQYSPGANPRFFTSESNIVQATLKADLGFADLASYSQYRREDADSSIDPDRIGLTLIQVGIPNDNVTWSQEFLLTSKPGSALQWTAGLFYFSNRDKYTTLLDSFAATSGRTFLSGSSSTTKTYAAFLDATYEVTPQFFVTAGVRYAHDTVTGAYQINGAGVRRDLPGLKNDKLTPRLVLRYKPSDNSSIYASYTKGYKAGILDLGGLGKPVEPENVSAFETGFKYDGGRFSFQTAAFYYDYTNMQVSLYRGTSAEIVNAATSEIYGLEGQFQVKVAKGFEVSAGATWIHARNKRFKNAPIYARCPAANQPAPCSAGLFFVLPGQTLHNTRMQRTPDFTGNIGARYTTELAGGELTLSGNLYYTSKFYFGPSGVQFPQKGYEVATLRAEWTDPSEKYSVALWGDNVTDSQYNTSVQYANFGIGPTWSKPVTYGIEFAAKF